ncbi:MAG: L-rhamnose/proton symporter RhaT [Candidatus Hinthialibacter antarcticus]|nr:L-rhamnose/proton symporter RhaT [Candidatus Hinthialibacter antarcticus]
MNNPFFGVFLHAIGGLAAASFYIPFKKVQHWSWESYWLVGGVFSWLVAPWVVAALTAPNVLQILSASPASSLVWCYLFGVLWGVGGLTFGLSMRYLGMSLGYAIALGFCAAFGTIIPPLFAGQFGELISNLAGVVTLSGVVVCLVGISFCGLAGIRKEKELPIEEKKKTVIEFDLWKGIWVALFAGVMSACMSFGINAGKPIADMAVQFSTPDIWKNTPVFIIILAGGFTTNLIWCLYLNYKNNTWGDYVRLIDTPIVFNYLFSALAGVTWYLQFMFYGMGTTQMGKYDFGSWTIHMAFIIIFSNIWGWSFHEWKGVSKRTHRLVWIGVGILLLSTIVVGLGNYLAE